MTSRSKPALTQKGLALKLRLPKFLCFAFSCIFAGGCQGMKAELLENMAFHTWLIASPAIM